MNLYDMRNACRRWLQNRSDVTDASIDEALNNAYLALCVGRFVDASRRERILRFPELERRSTTRLVYGTNAYDFPSDAYALDVVRYDQDGNGTWLRLKYTPHYNYARYKQQTGLPYEYTTHERTVYLYPWPAESLDGNDLELWYYIVPAEMGSDNDEPVISAAWHPLIVLRAVADLAAQYGLPDVAEAAEQRFAYELTYRRLPHEMVGDDTETGSIRR